MDENGIKSLTIALASIVVLMISLTTFSTSNVITVLAQEQEEEEEFNEECAELVDELKELDGEDISNLVEDGEEFQDLRISLIECRTTANNLEGLDPAVIGILGIDIISLIR